MIVTGAKKSKTMGAKKNKTTVAFVVNGGRESAMGHRARALSARLRGRYRVRVAYREGNRAAALFRFFAFLRRTRPRASWFRD